MQMYFIAHEKFLLYAESNHRLLDQIFMKQMFFLWANRPWLSGSLMPLENLDRWLDGQIWLHPCIHVQVIVSVCVYGAGQGLRGKAHMIINNHGNSRGG